MSEWFSPSHCLEGTILAPVQWNCVCGVNGVVLEDYLCARDVKKVLLLLYRLVETILPEGDDGDVELLSEFLEDIQRRFLLPKLELKHVWYAEQWHDCRHRISIFKKQDLVRAKLCISEIEADEYYPGGLGWPWI